MWAGLLLGALCAAAAPISVAADESAVAPVEEPVLEDVESEAETLVADLLSTEGRLALEDRLGLAEDTQKAPEAGLPANPLEALGPFGNLFLILGMVSVGGAAYVARDKIRPGAERAGMPPLRVVGQTRIAGQAGLALVEVQDGEGKVRRLVVGIGQGIPTLVSDLGAQVTVADVDDGIDVNQWMAESPNEEVVSSYTQDLRLPKPAAQNFDISGGTPGGTVFANRLDSAQRRSVIESPITEVNGSLSDEVIVPQYRDETAVVPRKTPRKEALGTGGVAVAKLGQAMRPHATANVRAELERRLAPARAAAKRSGTGVAALAPKRSIDEARSLVEQMLAERK